MAEDSIPLQNIFAVGLGFPANQESIPPGERAEGVSVYLKHSASLILAKLLTPEAVYGPGASSWHDRQNVNERKNRGEQLTEMKHLKTGTEAVSMAATAVAPSKVATKSNLTHRLCRPSRAFPGHRPLTSPINARNRTSPLLPKFGVVPVTPTASRKAVGFPAKSILPIAPLIMGAGITK